MKMGDFEFNLNHFFRYIYSGFILCLVVVLIFPDKSKEIYKVLGGNKLETNIFFLFFILSVGTVFYVLYKAFISEIMIENHHFNSMSFMRHSENDCIFRYLVTLGVEERQRLTAFRLVRDMRFATSIQKIFYLRHSEIHVLYETATACIIGGLLGTVSCFFDISRNHQIIVVALISIGLMSFVIGLIADGKLCEDECTYSRCLEEEITQILTEAKLLK